MTLTYRGWVMPWQCDRMGHMNTQFYAAAFDQAGGVLLIRGAGALSALLEQGLGWADVSQTVDYRHEVSDGDILTIYSIITTIGNSSVSYRHTMTLDDNIEAAVMEGTSVFFDLKARKARKIPPGIREKLDKIGGAPSSENGIID